METMEYKGLKAQIMRAQRLTGQGTHGLPPGTPIDIYPVDVFEHPLSHWITGAGNYVAPVDSDWGLWFNFTQNDQMNTAVLPSVKGMNPITGRRTNGFMLERYEDKCPEHGEKFKDGNFCEKCNFKWPDQNYLAYPNTLWWDGFRTTDGKVRQFFFTEELSKSIPELCIGKEDTVPAFGFAFFRPKVARQSLVVNTRSLLSSDLVGSHVYYTNYCGSSGNIGLGSPSPGTNLLFNCCLQESDTTLNCCSTDSAFVSSPSLNLSSAKYVEPGVYTQTVAKKKKTSEVGVGAGAEISQSLSVDTLKLDDWQTEPASVMRLYFIFIDQFNELKEKGLKDLSGVKEGFLEGLPVG